MHTMIKSIDNFLISSRDFIELTFRFAFFNLFEKSFDLSNSPKGIYMLQIRTREQFISKRIVIQ